MELSHQQAEAMFKIMEWVRNPSKQVFRLFGYAGTGKTTVVSEMVEQLNLKVAYGAYTGKAVSVMRSKGIPAQTIHNMIYIYNGENEQGDILFKLSNRNQLNRIDLIVIDECSMVDFEMGRDLEKFGKPILVIGDPAQLPPVGRNTGYFTSQKPDVLLTEVHRHQEGGAILDLATSVRQGEKLPSQSNGEVQILKGHDIDEDVLWNSDQVLVGTNKTRIRLNRRARSYFGMSSDLPQFGDKIVCLQNNHIKQIMNGEVFTVMDVVDRGSYVKMTIANRDENNPRVIENVAAPKAQFNSSQLPTDPVSVVYTQRLCFFDYAYAMTVHKSQGSQWDDVVLVDEGSVFRDDKNKWLYTGITRAINKLTVVKGRV